MHLPRSAVVVLHAVPKVLVVLPAVPRELVLLPVDLRVPTVRLLVRPTENALRRVARKPTPVLLRLVQTVLLPVLRRVPRVQLLLPPVLRTVLRHVARTATHVRLLVQPTENVLRHVDRMVPTVPHRVQPTENVLRHVLLRVLTVPLLPQLPVVRNAEPTVLVDQTVRVVQKSAVAITAATTMLVKLLS